MTDRPETQIQHSPWNSGRAFTLVELLVVVSVIALLIAILIPSMSKARKHAKAVLCMSRSRQLGVGMTMYLTEFDFYPAHQIRLQEIDPTIPEDVRIRWFDAMAIILSRGVLSRPHDMPAAEWEALKRANGFFEVQGCPSTPNWDVGRNNSLGYNYKYVGSFRDNADPRNPYAPLERFPVRSLRAPGGTIAFADCDGTGWTKPWAPEKPLPGGDHAKERFGNHGYILDPTYIPIWSDATFSGGEPESYAWKNVRTYLSDRHLGNSRGIYADGHGETINPHLAYRDNSAWNGLGIDPGVRPDGTQDTSHPMYMLDPHLPDRFDSSGGLPWRYVEPSRIARAG